MEQIVVNIPKPCHENWDQMDIIEQGRFCNACQAPVIDFTLLLDNEVLNIFSKATSSSTLCGQMHKTQLNRPIVYTKPTITFAGRMWGFVLGFMLLTSALKAQDRCKSLTAYVISETKNIDSVKKIIAGKKVQIILNQFPFNGSFNDIDHRKIEHVSVLINKPYAAWHNVTYEAIVIVKTKPNIPKNDDQEIGDDIAKGRMVGEYVVSPEPPSKQIVPEKYTLRGGIGGLIKYDIKEPENILTKVNNLYSEKTPTSNKTVLEPTIFPNPVKRNEQLTVVTEFDGLCNVRLLNIGGEIILSQNIRFKRKLMFKIPITLLPGNYFISIERRNKKIVKQIIVN